MYPTVIYFPTPHLRGGTTIPRKNIAPNTYEYVRIRLPTYAKYESDAYVCARQYYPQQFVNDYYSYLLVCIKYIREKFYNIFKGYLIKYRFRAFTESRIARRSIIVIIDFQ